MTMLALALKRRNGEGVGGASPSIICVIRLMYANSIESISLDHSRLYTLSIVVYVWFLYRCDPVGTYYG